MPDQPDVSRFLVLDVESTGLDAHAPGASLLEVGWILTTRDVECVELGRGEAIVRPYGSTADHDRLWAAMDPYVQQMHTDNGLWREATRPGNAEAYSASELDRAMSSWLKNLLPVGTVAQLAGSGVDRLDFPWLKRHLPELTSLLNYRALDISPIRTALEVAGRPEAAPFIAGARARPHRALPDCDDELVELRAWLRWLADVPAAEA